MEEDKSTKNALHDSEEEKEHDLEENIQTSQVFTLGHTHSHSHFSIETSSIKGIIDPLAEVTNSHKHHGHEHGNNNENEADDIHDHTYEWTLAGDKCFFQDLKKGERAVRICNTIDALFLKDFICAETIVLFVVEIGKIAIYIATTVINMKSCAAFDPSVLLISGFLVFGQISVMLSGKILRGFNFLCTAEDFPSDDDLKVFVRVAAFAGIIFVEVYFVIATFWYLNTLNDVIDGITSGLTFVVVSSLDAVVLSYLKIESIIILPKNYEEFTIDEEVGSSFDRKLKKIVKEFANLPLIRDVLKSHKLKYVILLILFSILYSIALLVSTSDHTDYQSTYC